MVLMLDDQLVLHGPMGAFPVGSAWETTEAVQCGDASLWPVSGLVFFGVATALAHGDDLCEGAPWPSLACLSRDPTCIARPRPGLAPKRRPTPTPIPPAPAKRPRGQSPTPATGGPGVEWRPRLPPSADRTASVWDPAPVSGGPVAGEAYSAWPTRGRMLDFEACLAVRTDKVSDSS